MEPSGCEFGVELSGALEVRNSFRRAVGGGEQEADLVLVSGVLWRELGEFFVSCKRAIRVTRLETLSRFGFELRNGLCGDRQGGEQQGR